MLVNKKRKEMYSDKVDKIRSQLRGLGFDNQSIFFCFGGEDSPFAESVSTGETELIALDSLKYTGFVQQLVLEDDDGKDYLVLLAGAHPNLNVPRDQIRRILLGFAPPGSKLAAYLCEHPETLITCILHPKNVVEHREEW